VAPALGANAALGKFGCRVDARCGRHAWKLAVHRPMTGVPSGTPPQGVKLTLVMERFFVSLQTILTSSMLVACLAAGNPAWAAGASGDRVPSYIEVTTDGAIIIEAPSNWNNPDGCLDPQRIFIQQSNAMIDRFYAATLTAYAGGHAVWAWLDGCETMGWGEQYPVVKNLATRRR